MHDIAPAPSTAARPAAIALQRAGELASSGRIDQALDAYRRLLDEDAGCAEAWYRKGLLHRQNGDTRLAMVALRRCAELKPDDPWPRFQLAQMLWSTGIGRRWESLGLFRQAFALDPGCAEFRLNLGHALHAVGQLADAAQVLSALPRTLPSWWAAARDHALRAYHAARAEACALLSRRRGAPERQLPVPDLLRLAGLLGSLGRYRPANTLALAMMRAHPHTWEAFAIRAEVLAKHHGPAPAAAFLDTLRWLFGGHPPYETALARLRYEDGDSDAAWKLLTPALRSASQESRALAGSVLLALREGDVLLEHCRQWIGDAPHDTAPYMFALAAQQARGALRPFDDGAAASAPAPGPHQPLALVQYWDSADPPEEVRQALSSWAAANPRLRHTVFCDARARDYLHTHYGADAVAAYDWCHHPAMKSDLFRLAYLARDGGVYVDADEFCRRPLLPLLAELDTVEFIAARSADVAPYLYNAFLLARPGSGIVAHALELMLDGLARARHARHHPDIWHATGPGVLTRAVAGLLVADPAVSARVLLLTKGQYESFSEERDTMAYKQTVDGNWRLSRR
ncbi:hypothetical protein BKK79_37110 (plasmid) [Cupriavidus sp. USMAA2-4]|uniref:tetratricopeptide repeat protein n=1 Tax=Cupriavidus sp. USMAA2-4 TaxID=876364 RepID=UPI0008A6D874|nr:tetratricopeptide repeat protein [Cupriavidus sp. USMAA2-4]AOY97560.1 hypothetical protein BKK79_37110 [Cupriavidus sp. USMAA2-4]